MAIHDWHENDRPREKLLKFGSQHLSDAELLAIFLRVGLPGTSAVELAEQLLSHFGSLYKLLHASQTEFCQLKGLGNAKYAQFKALLALSERYFQEQVASQISPNEPETVARFLFHHSGNLNRETFYILLLNQQNELIHHSALFQGTINQAEVHPREVAKLALDTILHQSSWRTIIRLGMSTLAKPTLH